MVDVKNTNVVLNLRQKAEELIKKRQSKGTSKAFEADALKLIHELEVYQIELELQNEELQLSKSAAMNAAEKYSELYDFSTVGYFTLSQNGEIIDLNLSGAQILGKERSLLRNARFGSFVSNESLEDFNLFLITLFNSEGSESCELSLSKNDSTPVNVHLKGIVTGNREQCQVNVVDITVLRQAETELKLKNEELIKVNAEKDKFFSILAHDLRGPFGSFLGLSTHLAENLSEMEISEVQEMLNVIRDSATSVFHLIENLLEWSKIQRGLFEFKPEPTPLIDVIKKSVDPLSDLIRQKEQKIKLQIPDNMIVKADIAMLESTFRNLISNALKFSFRGGEILVSTKASKDGFVEISVKDKGLGIKAQAMSSLFMVNGHTGCKGTEGELSSGLGLLLCREFVEKHGGNIWAESIEGKGSTFIFTLPLYHQDDEISQESIQNRDTIQITH